jgi:ankyrin repeat protein
MKDDAPPKHDLQATLWLLLRAIAGQERPTSQRLLAEQPALARLALDVGASRQTATSFFLDEISHYAYGGDTALHLAAAAHDPAMAELLLAHGADIRAKNRRGAEPLHYGCDGDPSAKACDPAAQQASVELLLRAGADPNAVDKNGVAALHRAVRSRSVGAVRALLENGVDAARENESGSAPLHLAVQDTGRSGSGSPAARRAQADVIRLLLDHGANPSAKNTAGKSAYDYAKSDWITQLLDSK